MRDYIVTVYQKGVVDEYVRITGLVDAYEWYRAWVKKYPKARVEIMDLEDYGVFQSTDEEALYVG